MRQLNIFLHLTLAFTFDNSYILLMHFAFSFKEPHESHRGKAIFLMS